ncbi:MAG: NusG domain II-containing protein [Methylophilaceae bacterium]|nr:NusG domain II-containing protein [Methylophilaceae bacterium]
MSLLPAQTKLANIKTAKPLLGDWLVIIAGTVLVIFLFANLWSFAPATKLLIRQGDKILGTYNLNQIRTFKIHGPLGDSIISIQNGKVRFVSSPCNNQYCVHQGWLKHAGEVVICLPNQLSLELLGSKKNYDTLNY